MKIPVDGLEVALRYVNQVKRTLGGSKKYRSFYTLLWEYRDGTLSAPDLISSVKELFSGHDDLLQGFTFFLPKEYTTTVNGDDVGGSPKRLKLISDHVPKEYATTVKEDDKGSHTKRQKFSDQVPKEFAVSIVKVDDKGYHPKRQKSSDDHVSKEYNTAVKVDKGFPKRRKFSDDVVSQIQQAIDLANKVRERFNDQDGVYKSFLDVVCGYKKEEKTTSEVEKELKLLFKDHPDLLIEISRYTADFYAVVDATEYEKSLWESMKKGKRDESYQKRKKKEDPYETVLFKCEDDHCEADVAFHRFESAKEKMELFLQVAKKTGGPITDLKQYFTPINLRCIEQLYYFGNEDEGYSLYMIDQLGKDPIKSGYIVLCRLNQKLEEIKYYLSGAETVWAKVYKYCHEKLQGV